MATAADMERATQFEFGSVPDDSTSGAVRISDSATMERTPPRTEQAGQGSNEMDKKNDRIAYRRIVAERQILRKYGRNTSHRQAPRYLP